MRQANLIILLVAASAFLVAQTDPPGCVGRLSYSGGPVLFQPAGVTDWVDANANRPPAQVVQQQPAQPVKQASVERPGPASRPRGAKDKPDQNDNKN